MKILKEVEAETFLEKHGFPTTKRIIVKTKQEAIKSFQKIKQPIVLKIIGKNILHKSDTGGVFTNLKTENEIITAFNKIKKIKNFQAVLIQPYIEGLSMILGIKKDPVFGPIILVGSGGIYTEILKDISIRIPPIDKKQANEMIKELKIYKILKGTRGQKFNVKKITNIITKLSNLTKKYNIKELDINPLIVNKKQAIVVDARIILE